MKDPSTRKHIVRLIGNEVRKEIRLMASENAHSVLCSQSTEDLKEFKWDELHAELSNQAPTLRSVLLAATKTRVPRPNTHVVIGTCVAILLKHRNPKMSLLQKIISLVLYAGHASKRVRYLLLHAVMYNSFYFVIIYGIQVHERLHKLNLTTSHSTLLSVVDKMGANHDARVLEWRDSLVTKLKTTNPAQVSEFYCYDVCVVTFSRHNH